MKLLSVTPSPGFSPNCAVIDVLRIFCMTTSSNTMIQIPSLEEPWNVWNEAPFYVISSITQLHFCYFPSHKAIIRLKGGTIVLNVLVHMYTTCLHFASNWTAHWLLHGHSETMFSLFALEQHADQGWIAGLLPTDGRRLGAAWTEGYISPMLQMRVRRNLKVMSPKGSWLQGTQILTSILEHTMFFTENARDIKTFLIITKGWAVKRGAPTAWAGATTVRFMPLLSSSHSDLKTYCSHNLTRLSELLDQYTHVQSFKALMTFMNQSG